jgi:ubiquinone/menaquinone biosynthesis C-methylase UbiE
LPEPDDAWDRYWAHGFLTSCRNAFSGNYEGTVRALWEAFFSEIPAGARILDIGTGNGAIPLIAAACGQRLGRTFDIHGIDLAAIRPADTVKADRDLLAAIEFHPRTPAEATGFAAASVHAVTGQYAYEYTHTGRAAAELARVAAPGAQLMFVMHHSESIVMETSREELVNARIIFEETRLFECAAALMEKVGAAATPDARRRLAADPEAESRRHALNAAAERVTNAIAASPHPQLLQMAMHRVADAYKALGGPGGLAEGLEILAGGQAMITANADRLHDLMQAEVSPGRLAEICQELVSEGFSLESPERLHHDGGPLMGWILRGRRT